MSNVKVIYTFSGEYANHSVSKIALLDASEGAVKLGYDLLAFTYTTDNSVNYPSTVLISSIGKPLLVVEDSIDLGDIGTVN